MRFIYTAFLLLILFSKYSFSQQFSDAIEDNSFFIEEAYNQEDRVVQHIFNATYFDKPQKDIALSFTQEWPFFSYRHQLSVTVPYSILNSNAVSGFNDIMINYRYQLFYKEDWAAVSPRISVILPTGNFDKGLGNNAFGLQLAVPASKRLSDEFVAHANLGVTYMPGVKQILADLRETKNDQIDYYAGTSLIWLTNENLNFMLEYLFTYTSEADENGNLSHVAGNILSPGIRYAININELQIVPGVAVPFSFSGGDQRTGLFLYLSFEHPF